jgi:hypothetical protein
MSQIGEHAAGAAGAGDLPDDEAPRRPVDRFVHWLRHKLHRLRHKLHRQPIEVVSGWRDGELWIGARCVICGEMTGWHKAPFKFR